MVKVSATTNITDATGDLVTGWVSYKGFHLIPAFQSAITNLVLMMNNKTTRVTVSNAPLPERKREDDDHSFLLPPTEIFAFILTYIFAGGFIYAMFAQVCAFLVWKYSSYLAIVTYNSLVALYFSSLLKETIILQRIETNFNHYPYTSLMIRGLMLLV